MPTYIDTTNLSPATIAQLQGPVISQIQITDNSYTVIDDTAVSTTGGYIKITGSNFTAGTQVVIGTVAATSVTYVNSTTLNVQVPAQSAGTYVVYVTVNTGSVAILVNGLTYSGTPTWVTGSTLPPGQVGTAISIQLSATGDAPLTYALAAGSSLPSGVTLTSGGLLSGTVTGITNETVYNFTINAIDAEAQDSPRGFSITITANDQYFNYVTALLSASTPTSTFVTDASTNSFAVTVNGDTRPSNFGPYTPGYYSNYFDGNGDYLSIADNVNLEFGSSTITVECWFYMTGSTGYLLDKNNSGTGAAPGFSLYVSTTQIIWYYDAENNGYVISPISTTVTQNAWHHIALVRSVSGSTTNSVFLDGVRVGTSSTSNAFPDNSQPFRIGATFLSGSPYSPFTGYISNVRLVKGTAVYDPAQTTITVPTTPLTAVANTQLLTCQSNRFIDNSTNNFTITRNGDTLVSGFDPFVPSASFAGRGSGYFDGTGDYLTLSPGSAFAFGTGDFTVECWYYPTSTPTYGYIVDARNSGQTNTWAFAYGLTGVNPGDSGKLGWFDGSTILQESTVSTRTNSWNHLCYVRSGTTGSLFVNGVRVATATNSTNINVSPTTSYICQRYSSAADQLIFGYVTDLRVVKGTAVYDPTQTTITVPTTPLTAIANTSLLTLQNNQPNNNNMFLDSSTNNFNITRNGNTTQGSFTPYAGTWSVNFPNSGVLNSQSTSGAYLSIPDNTGFAMGTGDFTMEGWIYPQSFPSSDNWPSAWFQTSSLFGRGTANLADGYNLILGATRLIFQNSDTNVTNGLHNMVVNNWYHVAACRSSGTLRLFVNGVQVASTSFTSSVAGGSNFFIGCETGQGGYFNGYMSNIRVLKGTALYTGAFTPPTQPLIPTSSTTLLTCADNRFIDDSNYRSVVTATNSPTIQKFSPFAPQLQQTPTSYSVAFDGTGDYLSCGTNSAFAMGTGDFTWEAWVYFASGSSFRQIFSTRPTNGSSTTAGSLSVSNTNGLNWYTNSAIINYTTSIGTDQWVHVAICRSSTTIRAFANGVIVGSATNSDNLTASTFSVGANNDGSEAFNGCISNVRVVKGTALYTANFTPSTTPLTAVAGTSLLTCQNTTIIDNSTNNFAITVNGNSQPIPQNPFGYSNPASTGGYTPALYGGSAYFDGTGDSLSLAGNSAFTLGAQPGDFTIECWVYLTTTPGNYAAFMTTWTDASTNYTNRWFLGIASSKITWYNDAGTFAIQDSVNVPLNQWIHVAAVRSGSTITLYKNGVSLGTQTTGQAYTTNGGLTMGYAGTNSNYITGYISDARIVRGTALYTSNFTPPVAPLTARANTVLLTNMTGAGIYDSSMMANYETVGNSSISTSLKKYGNTSMYFDGSGDYVFAPSSATTILTGNFTIELWVYRAASGNYRAFTIGDTVGTSGIEIYVSGTPTGNWVAYSNSATRITGASATREVWTHLALVRSGSTVTLYVNGTASGSTWSSSATFSGAVYVGAEFFNGGVTSDTNGYIDDFRITNGIARYTTTFTPPTSPFINF